MALSRILCLFMRLFMRLFMLLALSAASHAQPASPPPLYLGSVAMDVPAEMVKRLAPLARYLAAQTAMNVSFRASPNMETAITELGTGVTGITYLTPVAYIEARRKYGVQPLVAPLMGGQSTYRLMVVVKQASPLRNAAELKGKTFAFGDERARLQQAIVAGAGARLADFSSYAFLKHYDNIAKAVLNDDVDAGILTEGILLEFAPRGLRALYTSPPLPSYVFAVHRGLPPATVEKLRAAFLALHADSAEHRDILHKLGQGYDGFVPALDKDYDTVRKLIAQFPEK